MLIFYLLHQTDPFPEAELSVGGDGYFEMSIAHELETRMEMEVELKTTSLKGVILHAHGPSDYHILEVMFHIFLTSFWT